MRTEQLGELQCLIYDPAGEAEPDRLVVLSHGFGAPGTDLVPLAGELLHVAPALAENTRFIFPTAPLSLDAQGMYGGRAWWMIDLESRMIAIERGELDLYRNEIPAGMIEASDALLSVVEAALSQSGLEASRLILGGFSQGAMVSTDVALRMEQAPAALAVFSGTLLCEDRWREGASRRGPLKVLQTHGDHDPILPFACAEWLKELFQQAGFEVDFRPFPGVHQIPPTALSGLAELIQNL